ncbi:MULTISPECIES: ribosome silencing factor [Leuconostoc]|uniref:Ribosomal silencing factor RsfS n=2 Tax=Leuconostoc citreum TaxID=33964 RepID=B1MXH8_LEUCK|nr:MULTISPECIES: ribosome silencing factor [Leuconostoc]ACA82230.1 YqeL [Leuconostoc citreum KM20]KAF0260364.1 ribosome silencing factor [Leuconostoc citreum]MBA5938585.1 ribosome silencing factor [Leuconostoc citreum]MBE4726208.1 ribosome silencing factor [Leuconostoc citreum]MBU7451419.1 ribosome silencing factor [Leuconostoc citreum]
MTTALDVNTVLETAVKAIDGKKANNIVALDMRNVSLMADYFVIADAASNRQVQAIVTEVKDKVQAAGGEVKLIEGFQSADWVLVDLGDVIVHVFSTEQRDFYNLERLWHDAPYVDLTTLLIAD